MIKIPKLHIGNQFTDNQCCFGLATAAIISSAIAAAAGGAQAVAASNLNKRNRKWQAKQNEIARQWNAEQTDLSRQWQESMYNKYDTPSAQRAMIEQAGYNPYLVTPEGTTFQGGSAAAAPTTTATQLPQQFNPLDGLTNASSNFGNLLTSLAGAKSSQAQASNTDYMTKRQQLIDAVNSGDINAVTAEGLNKIYESRAVKAAADKTAAEAAIANIQSVWMSSQALDENSQPVVDDDGSPVSNYEYEQRGNQANIWKGYNKLQQDITESAERVANLKVDELTKKYNLDELLPAQKAQILTSISKLKSDIELNSHQARALDASAYSSIASGYNSYSMANYNKALTKTEDYNRNGKHNQLFYGNDLIRQNIRKSQNDWNNSSKLNEAFGMARYLRSFSLNPFGTVDSPGWFY